jgi:hypothetical protein
MSEATIRARIKTVVSAVANVGIVHDYERMNANWEELLKQFQSGGQLRGWIVTCDGAVEREVIAFQGGGIADTILVTWQHKIRGFMALDDSAATEKTMAALAETIVNALEADATLQSKAFEKEDPVVRSVGFSTVMFAGVLCHYAEIILRPQEIV